MTMEKTELPHMIVFERVLGLPVVESALTKSAQTYFRVKNINQLMNWALNTAEMSLSIASKQTMPIAVPIARRFESPIQYVDQTLCLGLDKIEEKVPLLKETPQQILNNAYMYAAQTVAPVVANISYVNDLIIDQVIVVRNISWKKVNIVLDTQYGTGTVRGVDNTVTLVDNLIEKYFPPLKEEEETKMDIVSADEDKLLHILQTIGHMSIKSAKRIYANIKHILGNIKILGMDYLRYYILKLTEFLNAVLDNWRIEEDKKTIKDSNGHPDTHPTMHPDHKNEVPDKNGKENSNSYDHYEESNSSDKKED